MVLALLALAPAAHACDRGASDPADQPPFGGDPVPRASAPLTGNERIPGFELTPEGARTIAIGAIEGSNRQRAVIRTLVDGDQNTEWRSTSRVLANPRCNRRLQFFTRRYMRC